MPLEAKKRGNIYWAYGRVEFNGKPITKYIRRSTGAFEESGAKDWIRDFEAREIRRHLIGGEEDKITMGAAIRLYDKPSEAKRLLKIVDAFGDDFLNRKAESFTGRELRDIARILMPDAASDTWRREVVTPLRSVTSRYMHKCMSLWCHLFNLCVIPVIQPCFS